MSQVTWYIIYFEKYCQGFLSFFFFSMPDTESDVPSAQQFTLASNLHRLQHNQLYVLGMMSLIFPLHQIVHKHDRGIMALGNALYEGEAIRIHTIISHFLLLSAMKFLSEQADLISFFLSEDCETRD